MAVDNTLFVVVWSVAAAVTAWGTIVVLRASHRGRHAAGMVAHLLEPGVVEPEPSFETAEAPLPASSAPDGASAVLAVDGSLVGLAPPPAESRVAADCAPAGDRDPGQARIPVFDLDRLRWWLTDGEVVLGRIAVVSVELDNLAAVTARLGDTAGADLIEAITTRLRAVTRPRDVVAHVNTERFVLVCRDVPTREVAEALAERVAMGVAHPAVVTDGVAEVTASIGVALAFAVHERPENVLARAIKAGNHARDLGGARIEISMEAPSPTIRDDEFAGALMRGELLLHYMPIVSCATGRVAGLESLIRWDHPTRGLLLPSEFLPDAERTGAIVEIGAWALEQACVQMAEWHQSGGERLKLDINLSRREFAEPRLPALVKRVIGDTGLAPDAVWLEITEETLAQDREASDDTLRRLHEIGVRLVIDDFGTGASSLVSLKQFPFDAIKIDRAFIADLGRNRESDAVCSAITELAHSLGLCAIAEGVETLEQLTALRGFDCELGQGHLFGPARAPEDYGSTPATILGVEPAPEGA